MGDEQTMISLQEAAHEVALTSRRIALLHLAYARTLVEELGEERGRKLIVKAIKQYGMYVGKEAREAVLAQGLEPKPENFGEGVARGIPRFGMHSRRENVEVKGETRLRAHGCVMGKVWRNLGEDRLGRLYCLVDPAKLMTYNPHYKLVHAKCLPDGDPYCEFCMRRTTEMERCAFESSEADWTWIDRC